MSTTRDVITRAFGELMFMAEGETPSAAAMSDALDALNDLLASWRTLGMVVVSVPGFPTGNWRGDWQTNTSYAVSDAVMRSGSTYVCSTVHTSSLYDKPGVSPNWASYWTATAATTLALDDTFPVSAEFHRGIIAILAVEMAPKFNIDPKPLTMRKASEGLTALMAAFLPINPVRVDNGIIRMPSQIWPYNIDQVS